MSGSINFEYYRLILSEDLQLNILQKQTTRYDTLKDIFSNDFDFNSKKGKCFKYIFKSATDNYILGQIFERDKVDLLEDPNNIEKQTHYDWKPSFVIINLGKEKGIHSQLFLLESNFKSKPEERLNFLKNVLADKVNYLLKGKAPYSCEFRPTTEVRSFWELAKCEDLKEMIVEYSMPNFLGIGDKLQEKLNEMKVQMNATKVKEVISNENGNLVLDESYQDLNKTIESTNIGQTRVKLKNINNTQIYDSETSEIVKTRKIDEISIEVEDPKQAKALLETILKRLELN